MKRTIFSLAVLGSLAVSAAPYTKGWLTYVPKPADTNYLELSGDFNSKSASVITNRPKPKLAMMKSNLLSAKSNAAPSSLDDFEKLLPNADDARLKELARGLEYDWEKCFDFVRNHIAFSLYPGIMRGAERTLIDREGNDADQSLLLVALLRLSGYEASVIYEPAQIDSWIRSGFALPIFNYNGESPYNVADWLGIKSSGSAQVIKDTVLSRLRTVGYNYATLNTTSVVIPHYWVALKIGDVTQYLDPSLKPSKATFAHDAMTDMGYDREALIAAAGGTTISGMGVRNLSVNGIASHLNSLCANLRNVWTNANESAEYFVGSKKILKRTDDAYFHGKYFSDSQIDLSKQPAEYVNALRTKTVLTCNGSAFYEFYLDEVGLRNLWLTSSGSTTVLHLDDAVLKSISTSSNYYNIELLVDVQHFRPTTHPYYLTRGDDRVYSLVVGFGGDAKNGMRKYASEEMTRVKESGLDDATPRMIAASLYVQGQQWLSQCVMSLRLMNKINSDNHQYYYNIGIAGQNGGPYVDMANCFMHSGKNTSEFSVDGLFSSALEHSVVEQLNDTKAVSTVKILNLANQNGNAVYFVTSQNVESVANQISNYSSSFKSSMLEDAKAGATYLLPANGSTTLNQWNGTGYVEHFAHGDGTVETTMAISGGMNGGYASEETSPESNNYYNRTSPSRNDDTGITFIGYADPVSMPFGSYEEKETDLVLNRGNPLMWERTYSSMRPSNRGLGRGWVFSCDASVFASTDPDSLFGDKAVQSVLPSVVAMGVVADLLSEQRNLSAEENARRWMAAAIIVQWWTERLNGTYVTVDYGDSVIGFQKRYDGEFIPPLGSTAQLFMSNNCYHVKQASGSILDYNSLGRLERAVDANGNETRFKYTYDSATNAHLTTVENDFDARFSIEWQDKLILKVSDNADRTIQYQYDENDCLIGVIDPMGKTWRYDYQADKKLATKIDPIGNVLIDNRYNVFGQVTNQITATGGVWEFGYAENLSCWNKNPLGCISRQGFDVDGRPMWVENRYGGVSRVRYNSIGLIEEKVETDGLITSYKYDSRYNVIENRVTGGKIQRVNYFAYNECDKLISLTNTYGYGILNAYDKLGRMVSSTDPLGCQTIYEWNPDGSLKTKLLKDSRSLVVRQVDFEYNKYGLVSEDKTTGIGLPTDGIVQRYSYTPMGTIRTSIDPNGNQSKCEYDVCGRLIKLIDPLGGVVSSCYDDAGRLIGTTDKMGRQTSFVLSPSGKIILSYSPDGSMTSNTYDKADNLVAMTDARGVTTKYDLDPMGQVATMSNGISTSRYERDASGKMLKAINFSGNSIDYYYDELGRCFAKDYGGGSLWSVTYDLLDQVVATKDPLGRVVHETYDKMGNRIAIRRASGYEENFQYDFHGKVCRAENAEHNYFCIGRDGLGRMLAMTNALGRQVYRATYDHAGNCISEIDANNRETSCVYDALGLPTKKKVGTRITEYNYDKLGNTISAIRENGERLDFSIDIKGGIGFAQLQTKQLESEISWMRDRGGYVTNITYGLNKNLTRTYDSLGRLVSISDWNGNVWLFEYNMDGQITRRSHPDGIKDEFHYGRMGLVESWKIGTMYGSNIHRDCAGRRVAETIETGLLPAGANDETRVGSFNQADQLMSMSGFKGQPDLSYAFAYDNCGAVTNVTSSEGNVFSIGYGDDAKVRVIHVKGDDIEFDYDPCGNRIWVDGHCFIPDYADSRNRPLIELDEKGQIVQYYIWVNEALIGIVTPNGDCLSVHSDPNGNVRLLRSLSGEIIYSVDYAPNGTVLNEQGINPSPFGWQGGFGVQKIKRFSAIGDCYLMGARIYAAKLQRFLSPDPTFISGGLNLYAYANNNPIAYHDPSGFCPEGIEIPDNVNVYSMDEIPEGGKYKAGDLVVLSNGKVYRVNEDMYVTTRIQREAHWSWKEMRFEFTDVKNFRDELLATDPNDAGTYENGNSFVNTRIAQHNMLIATPVVVETVQFSTSGAPKNIVELAVTVKDGVDLVNDAKELEKNVLPFVKTPTSPQFLELTRHRSNGNNSGKKSKQNGGGGRNQSGSEQPSTMESPPTVVNPPETPIEELLLREKRIYEATLEAMKNAGKLNIYPQPIPKAK